MKKVMVIGAGGWLGTKLTQRLIQAGRKIICVDIYLPKIFDKNPAVEVIRADIRDTPRFAARLSECTAVFNCAGVQHPKATSDIYAVNCDAAAAAYRECIERGVNTFVHISSINAQGENPSPTEFLDESLPPRPITHYGKSKSKGDTMLQSLNAPGNTRLIILRPAVFYGEFPSKNLREFMEKLKTSVMPLFSKAGMIRTYVDVETVVDALVLSEHQGRSGEIYLIGDDAPLSTLKFYQIIASELGAVPRLIRIPLVASRLCEWLALFAGRLGRHIRLFTIVGEFGRHTFCTSAKAKQELGLTVHKSSEPGLRAMARSVQEL